MCLVIKWWLTPENHFNSCSEVADEGTLLVAVIHLANYELIREIEILLELCNCINRWKLSVKCRNIPLNPWIHLRPYQRSKQAWHRGDEYIWATTNDRTRKQRWRRFLNKMMSLWFKSALTENVPAPSTFFQALHTEEQRLGCKLIKNCQSGFEIKLKFSTHHMPRHNSLPSSNRFSPVPNCH